MAVESRGPIPAKATAVLNAEIARIRRLFLSVFAEAIVKRVQGEDAIWLIEDGTERRLYVWECVEGPRPSATNRGNGKSRRAVARLVRHQPSNDTGGPTGSDSEEGKRQESKPRRGGQSGRYIASLVPNEKELTVARFLRGHATSTLADIAAGCFSGESRGNSWTRNSLRRLVRARWAAKLRRGTYDLTPEGRTALAAVPGTGRG